MELSLKAEMIWTTYQNLEDEKNLKQAIYLYSSAQFSAIPFTKAAQLYQVYRELW
jgi:predicted HTH domain antitoxin